LFNNSYVWHDSCNVDCIIRELVGEHHAGTTFVIGFFVMLLATGVSLLGILAAIVVATVSCLLADVCADDQTVAVATAGHCGGVGDSGD
jgi:hypothetical protein